MATDYTEELERLNELKSKGVLTPEEFEREKQKVLNLGPLAFGPGGATPQTPNKSFVAAALLAFFLGYLGIDRFYLGYTGLGIAKLCLWISGWFLVIPFFIVGAWALVDFILIVAGKLNDSQGKPLAR